jgi:hypothetical protein
MTLKYELKFYDYWHLSSGLSAGAKLDSTVVKDDDGLPYASGKTIKGLVREMALLNGDCDFINRCFGTTTDKEDICFNKNLKEKSGECYFTNTTIDEDTKKEIVLNNLQDNLYDVIASTKIGDDGIAVDDTLREIEVVIPLSLYGEILDIPSSEDYARLTQALKMIKRMGLNRNRGLGRCEFFIGARDE